MINKFEAGNHLFIPLYIEEGKKVVDQHKIQPIIVPDNTLYRDTSSLDHPHFELVFEAKSEERYSSSGYHVVLHLPNEPKERISYNRNIGEFSENELSIFDDFLLARIGEFKEHLSHIPNDKSILLLIPESIKENVNKYLDALKQSNKFKINKENLLITDISNRYLMPENILPFIETLKGGEPLDIYYQKQHIIDCLTKILPNHPILPVAYMTLVAQGPWLSNNEKRILNQEKRIIKYPYLEHSNIFEGIEAIRTNKKDGVIHGDDFNIGTNFDKKTPEWVASEICINIASSKVFGGEGDLLEPGEPIILYFDRKKLVPGSGFLNALKVLKRYDRNFIKDIRLGNPNGDIIKIHNNSK